MATHLSINLLMYLLNYIRKISLLFRFIKKEISRMSEFILTSNQSGLRVNVDLN